MIKRNNARNSRHSDIRVTKNLWITLFQFPCKAQSLSKKIYFFFYLCRIQKCIQVLSSGIASIDLLYNQDLLNGSLFYHNLNWNWFSITIYLVLRPRKILGSRRPRKGYRCSMSLLSRMLLYKSGRTWHSNHQSTVVIFFVQPCIGLYSQCEIHWIKGQSFGWFTANKT
jgi:hypothetical protein